MTSIPSSSMAFASTRMPIPLAFSVRKSSSMMMTGKRNLTGAIPEEKDYECKERAPGDAHGQKQETAWVQDSVTRTRRRSSAERTAESGHRFMCGAHSARNSTPQLEG